MRSAVVLGTLLIIAIPAAGQKKEPPPAPRHGIEVDFDAYPQDSAKTALASVLKAIDARQFSYLAAQLADPSEVDKKVQSLGGSFERFVKQVTNRLADDPETVRQLRRFASEGQFSVQGDEASVSLKDIKGRQVFLRRIGNRWFLQDRQKAVKEKP